MCISIGVSFKVGDSKENSGGGGFVAWVGAVEAMDGADKDRRNVRDGKTKSFPTAGGSAERPEEAESTKAESNAESGKEVRFN